MRFLFCDRILRTVKGECIEGIKAFSLSEEFLNEHFPAAPLVPAAIFLETMAQFLGWLILYSHDFQCFPIISLLEDVQAVPNRRPGFEAHVSARILSTSKTDSLGRAEIRVDGQTIARANRMIYSHFSVSDSEALKKQFHSMVQSQGFAGGRVDENLF